MVRQTAKKKTSPVDAKQSPAVVLLCKISIWEKGRLPNNCFKSYSGPAPSAVVFFIPDSSGTALLS